MMAGIVSLGRMTDKARAFNAGTLGEYHFDCPHDKPVLAFLGISAPEFAAKVKELGSDSALETYVKDRHLAKKTPAEIAAFNDDRRKWRPDPGPSAAYFAELHAQLAPNRPEIVTWFDILDLDEGRKVERAHA